MVVSEPFAAADSDRHSIVQSDHEWIARITSVKSFFGAKPSTIRELEHELRSLGFSQREASGIATRGFPSLHPSSHEGEESNELALVRKHLTPLAIEIQKG